MLTGLTLCHLGPNSYRKTSFSARKCDPQKDKALFSKENEICNLLAAFYLYQFKS